MFQLILMNILLLSVYTRKTKVQNGMFQEFRLESQCLPPYFNWVECYCTQLLLFVLSVFLRIYSEFIVFSWLGVLSMYVFQIRAKYDFMSLHFRFILVTYIVILDRVLKANLGLSILNYLR